MRLFKKVKIFTLTLITLFLAGCMMPQFQLENLKDLKKDEVIYVGKLQLIPHIRKDEVIYKRINGLLMVDI